MIPSAIPIFLDPPPVGRSLGDMSDSDDSFAWVQPNDRYRGSISRFHGLYRLDGKAYEVKPYDFLLSPPGSRCEIERWGEPPYAYVAFHFSVAADGGDLAWLPIRKPVNDAEFWYASFVRAARRVSVTMGLFRSLVPAFLWSVVEFGPPPSKNVYVATAERIIAERIGQPIRISDLAREIGISQSQLNRQFLQEVGSTPMQYVLERRAELAHRLLTGSSSSFKDIARTCGFPDTHSFGRFVRDRLGAAPRSIRQRVFGNS